MRTVASLICLVPESSLISDQDLDQLVEWFGGIELEIALATEIELRQASIRSPMPRELAKAILRDYLRRKVRRGDHQ